MTVSTASIIIPAHNEARVIGRLLSALAVRTEGRCEVVVAANGCTDDTTERASEYADRLDLRVLDLPHPSKTAALNTAEGHVRAFPRVFLDADVLVSAESVEQVCHILRSDPSVLVARPPVHYDTRHADASVRAFYRARSRTPELMTAVWGAGLFAVSERGRTRWARFPAGVADDFFVDSLFAHDEKRVVDAQPVVVVVPRTAAALLRTLRRVYNPGQAAESQVGARGSARTLVRVLRANMESPRAVCDAIVYVSIAVLARGSKFVRRRPDAWERDDTSREGDSGKLAE